MIEIGSFVIMGDWDTSPEPADRIVIRMPVVGRVYGAGWQPSTTAALLGLAERVTPGMTVLDYGTGTGLLAVAAAKLGASRVYATEHWAEARELADRVFGVNQVAVEWDPQVSVDLCIANIGESPEWEGWSLIRATTILTVDLQDQVVEVVRPDA